MAGEAKFKFNDKGMKALLKRLEKNNESIRKKDQRFVNIIWTNIFADVMNHFEKEEGPKGGWQELSKVTLANRKGGSGKILQDTGTLRQSFRPDTPVPYKVSATKISFTNPISYSGIHDNGGKTDFNGRTVKIPQREFMYLSSKRMKMLSQDVAKFMEGGK